MQIEFNPGRPTQTGASAAGPRQTTRSTSEEIATFPQTRQLESRLAAPATSRPEEVERARRLIADVKYPPDEMMSRIAHLLALHLRGR